MTIIMDDLLNGPRLDMAQLEIQVGRCEGRGPGDYFLNLVDKQGYARVGIFELNASGEGRVYERFPVHGVSFGRGSIDSYDGLISILDEGFNSLSDRYFNACVQAEDITSSLAKIASGEERTVFGVSSKKPETNGDRYFLEFKRFSTSYDWKAALPSHLFGPTHISVGRVETSDIQVNVILGTTDSAEIKKRISAYQTLFDQYGVTSRFITDEGLVNTNNEPLPLIMMTTTPSWEI
ncbi:hypothetical protein HOB06_05270 [archaeon]|jgi:hypothetical protein|nr:hypothetical protein [archaeon]